MSLSTDAYVNLPGTAEEALTFYKKVFSAEIHIMRFGEMPPMPGYEDMADKVMHGELRGGDVHFMVSDGADDAGICNAQLALSGTDKEQIITYFNALAEGGLVTEEIQQAPWGDSFGALTDKFGVKWMVNITQS